jgi:hypothetical protein
MLYRYNFNGYRTYYHGGNGFPWPDESNQRSLYVIEITDTYSRVYIDDMQNPMLDDSNPVSSKPTTELSFFKLSGSGIYDSQNGNIHVRDARVFNRVLTMQERNVLLTVLP